MRRSKIVPASPTGFPREQDLMFPFPQNGQEENTTSKTSKKKPSSSPSVKQPRTETDHSAVITPPPPPLPSTANMINGHSQNGDAITNGHGQRNGTREIVSPPLPLPPTPEPASNIPLYNVKSPPPPSPPIPNDQEIDAEVEQATEKNGGDNKISDENEEKEAQKVRYFIIPSPGPSGTPKKESSPVKIIGTII